MQSGQTPWENRSWESRSRYCSTSSHSLSTVRIFLQLAQMAAQAAQSGNSALAQKHFQEASQLQPQSQRYLTAEIPGTGGVMKGTPEDFLVEEIPAGGVDTVITLCDEAEKNCPTSWPGVTRRLHWSILDPAAVEGSPDEKLAAFRAARDQIDALVRGWLASQRPPRGV